jgi:hypothetical protein
VGKSGGVVWWSGEGYGGFIGGDGSEVVHGGGSCCHRCRIIGSEYFALDSWRGDFCNFLTLGQICNCQFSSFLKNYYYYYFIMIIIKKGKSSYSKKTIFFFFLFYKDY